MLFPHSVNKIRSRDADRSTRESSDKRTVNEIRKGVIFPKKKQKEYVKVLL
jgi:hypothetical protein